MSKVYRLLISAAGLAALTMSAACDVKQTKETKLPSVDVEVKDKGQVPKYDVVQTQEGRMPDVDVEAEGGEMPEFEVETADVDVSMEKKTIEVPDVDIDMPDDEE